MNKDKKYSREETLSLLDKSGYYKHKLSDSDVSSEERTIDGMKLTDPPILNKDGLIVSKDGRTCSSKPVDYNLHNTPVSVVRVVPNCSDSNWTGRNIIENLFEVLLDDSDFNKK